MNPDCEDCILWLKPLKDLHKSGHKILVLVSQKNSKNQIFYKYDLRVLKALHYFWLVHESPSIYQVQGSKISHKFESIDSIDALVMDINT